MIAVLNCNLQSNIKLWALNSIEVHLAALLGPFSFVCAAFAHENCSEEGWLPSNNKSHEGCHHTLGSTFSHMETSFLTETKKIELERRACEKQG